MGGMAYPGGSCSSSRCCDCTLGRSTQLLDAPQCVRQSDLTHEAKGLSISESCQPTAVSPKTATCRGDSQNLYRQCPDNTGTVHFLLFAASSCDNVRLNGAPRADDSQWTVHEIDSWWPGAVQLCNSMRLRGSSISEEG